MEINVEQGDIIEFVENRMQVLVLSKNFFNQSGLCVVCPVVENTAADALHIRVKADSFVGIAMCEQLKTMDLKNRYFRKKGSLSYGMIQEITDAVQSIFDYYPYE